MDELRANKFYFFRDAGELPNLGANIHYHSYFEIYRLTDGVCDNFVGDKMYPMRPGDIVVIPPGAIHGTHYTTGFHGRTLIYFSFHYLPKHFIEAISGDPLFYRCEKTREEVGRIFEKIGAESNSSDSFGEDVIRALLTQLIAMILRFIPKENGIVSESNFIETAINYIQKNYQNPITLEDIARVCDVSKVHLSRKFKEKVGVGLNEYIKICRMKKAKELLLMQDKMSICEIAYECGFNDSNYFSWLFKKTYGVAPVQYRKNTRA